MANCRSGTFHWRRTKKLKIYTSYVSEWVSEWVSDNYKNLIQYRFDQFRHYLTHKGTKDLMSLNILYWKQEMIYFESRFIRTSGSHNPVGLRNVWVQNINKQTPDNIWVIASFQLLNIIKNAHVFFKSTDDRDFVLLNLSLFNL